MPIKSPDQIIDAAAETGYRKACLNTSYGRLTALSAMAGAFIALGGALSIVAGFGFPELSAGNPSLQKLLSGLAFPIGLVLTVVLGAELFTGNNAMLIPSLRCGKVTPRQILVNWTIVWLGNFLGALLFGFLLIKMTGTFDPAPYSGGIISMASAKAALPWEITLMRGIGANWCVCLAVWLALSADTLQGKALGCWLPVAAFVILGYEHCVANMFFIPTAMMLGADIAVADLAGNLLFATIGNIIGGALFVGTLHTYTHLRR